jgi:voltage-gated potassium channel
MLKKLYPIRFELFLFSQVAILFGSLIVPLAWFESWISPLLFLLNLMVGVIFVSHKKRLFIFLSGLLILSGFIFIIDILDLDFYKKLRLLRLASFFAFYAVVSLEIIKQVTHAKDVNKNVILGLISGYISLGLLAFFMFLTIEMLDPNSFSGLINDPNSERDLADQLLYFSYVTLLTIGYGEIIPVSSLAQKAAVLVALLGQFYLVILTAIVVGKYINQSLKTN